MADEKLLNWVSENYHLMGLPSGGFAVVVYFLFPRVLKFLKHFKKIEKTWIYTYHNHNYIIYRHFDIYYN